MPITLITGPANAGKAQVVLNTVRRGLAHGEEPLLIVPTRADAEHYLRELAGGFGRERLLATLLEHDPAMRPSPGLIHALGALLAELRVRRVSPARLRQAFASWSEADGPGPSRDG